MLAAVREDDEDRNQVERSVHDDTRPHRFAELVQAAQHQADADLQSLIATGRGDAPLVALAAGAARSTRPTGSPATAANRSKGKVGLSQ